MLRCPVCDSVRVVLVLNGESRAFCGRCGSRWLQEGGRQFAIEPGARREGPVDHPA